MKLYIEDENRKRKVIDVNFWSFMKCTFLVQLALTGMVYGVILFFVLVGLILGGLK